MMLHHPTGVSWLLLGMHAHQSCFYTATIYLTFNEVCLDVKGSTVCLFLQLISKEQIRNSVVSCGHVG